MLALMMRPWRQKDLAPFDHWSYMTDHYRQIFDELGEPLVPIYSAVQLKAVAELCAGLIVPGNINDIPPHYYGQQPMAGLDYSADDYALDAQAVQLFASQNKPILGICSGIQVVNVFFGGTLHQRIPNHYRMDGARHGVRVEPHSFVSRAYDLAPDGAMQVNTFHNQALDRVAEGFAITARADDGTVEAIERGNIIAVQWHPEASLDLPFFKAFLELTR